MRIAKNIIIVCCVVAVVFGYVAFAQFKSQPQPVINPHPRYFVTISGNIDPHLKHPIYLAFWATYGAYHPQCKVWISHFEGVEGMPGHPDFYPAKPDAQGNYVVKIPIDRYVPGKCDWKIAWIDFSYAFHPFLKDKSKAGGVEGLMQFGHYPKALPAIPVENKETLHGCKDNNIESCKGYVLVAGYTKLVSRIKSYHFYQDIKS